jgi:hypothetical protein
MNVMQKEGSKGSLRGKFKRAGWDDAYLRCLLALFDMRLPCVIQIPDSCGSAVIRRMRQPGIDPNWLAKRQSIEPDVWHKAANGRLASVLTEGWSTSETWGTWGVGSSHRIRLLTDSSPDQYLAVDLDIHAFVWDETIVCFVDVFVNNQLYTSVTFIKAQRLRLLSLERLPLAKEDGSLTLEFRPKEVVAPKDLGLSDETRALGVALHGIRLLVVR